MKTQPFYRGAQFSKPMPTSRAVIGRVDHISAFVSGLGEKLITIDGREQSHYHPCEVCGKPVDCEDFCDGNQQTIVYCHAHRSYE